MLERLKSFYKKHKKTISITLRVVISVGLILYLVLTKFRDFRTVIETLRDINITFLLLSAATHVFGIWITAVRWQTLLKTQDVTLSLSYLTSTVLIGFFFNNFLPTTIGGDVFRAYDISRKSKLRVGSSLSIIVVERGSGVISAATYAVIALFLGFTAIGGQSIIIPIVIFFAVTLILAFFLLNPSFLKLDRLFEKVKFLAKIREKLENVYETFKSFKKYKFALAKVLFYSFCLQFAVILNYWLASKSLGIELGLTAFIFISPVVATIAMLPISIGGIGLRENSLVLIMTSLGAMEEKAAITSLLIFFMLIVIGIIGGIIYLVRPFILKRKEVSTSEIQTDEK